MEYIVALGGIVMVNLLLSGDNALVIALASRNLSTSQQKTAMLWGSAGAVGLRVLLTFAAVLLLKLSYLQLAGGLLLLWIAVKLIADDHHGHDNIRADNGLWGAVKTIIAADFVMSLDNVLAIAGVAKGNMILLIIGLAISIPIIVWGSKVIGVLMERWPLIVVLGGAFLGWTGGEMVIADQAVLPILIRFPWFRWGLPVLFTLIVVILGEFFAKNNKYRGG